MGRILNELIKQGAVVGPLVFSLGLVMGSSILAPSVTSIQPAARVAGFGASLNIYVPSASNYVNVPLALNLQSDDDPAQRVLGVWNGTWSGTSFSRPIQGQSLSQPINGTWTLDLQTLDADAKTASGTLTWNGKDIYWTYTFDSNGVILTAAPHDFIPNRIITFNGSNTTLTAPGPGTSPQYGLVIDGAAHAPNPSDAFYGPWFSIALFPDGKAMSFGNGFLTHPYTPRIGVKAEIQASEEDLGEPRLMMAIRMCRRALVSAPTAAVRQRSLRP